MEYYRDVEGIFFGVGELVSDYALRELYSDIHDDDPVVSSYESFESWLHDCVYNGYLIEY